MTIDKTIFGMPFLSDEKLQPAQEQLSAFLAARSRKMSAVQKADDLKIFRALLERIDAFERKKLPETEQNDIQKQLFYGALHYSQFADHTLLSAVELFHYQKQAMAALDFSTPTDFIESAQATISKLSKKKLDDVTRMLRLQEMISERKKIIDRLTLSWEALAAELRRIALYLTDNLAKIEERCELSIIRLSDLGVTSQKESRIVEDIKTYFKEKLKHALHAGSITPQDMQNSLKEANQITDELSIALREDINTLTGLYEALHDHLKQTIQAIEALLEELDRKKGKSPQDRDPHFTRLEQVLDSLLSIHRLEQESTGIHTETAHEKLITLKRKEMLDYLFELVQQP